MGERMEWWVQFFDGLEGIQREDWEGDKATQTQVGQEETWGWTGDHFL